MYYRVVIQQEENEIGAMSDAILEHLEDSILFINSLLIGMNTVLEYEPLGTPVTAYFTQQGYEEIEEALHVYLQAVKEVLDLDSGSYQFVLLTVENLDNYIQVPTQNKNHYLIEGRHNLGTATVLHIKPEIVEKNSLKQEDLINTMDYLYNTSPEQVKLYKYLTEELGGLNLTYLYTHAILVGLHGRVSAATMGVGDEFPNYDSTLETLERDYKGANILPLIPFIIAKLTETEDLPPIKYQTILQELNDAYIQDRKEQGLLTESTYTQLLYTLIMHRVYEEKSYKQTLTPENIAIVEGFNLSTKVQNIMKRYKLKDHLTLVKVWLSDKNCYE